MPALVIACELYDDADQVDDIIKRNNIRHPLFVAGGRAIEVLSEE
jgi:prophage DNA circulation protein